MRYEEHTGNFILTIEEFVGIAYRHGDLDVRHRRDPLKRPPFSQEDYRSLFPENVASFDVPLCRTDVCDGLRIIVAGTADVVLFGGGQHEMEMLYPVSEAAVHFHPPEVIEILMKCYAFFLCSVLGQKEIETRVINHCAKSGNYHVYARHYTSGDLAVFYAQGLEKASRIGCFLRDRQTGTLPRSAAAPFPYPTLREGQDELIHAVWRAIRHEKRLFVQAPTGIGKTASTLYPAVRALGSRMCDKIFYLTAKAATRAEAVHAAQRMNAASAPVRTVVITAREQACLHGSIPPGEKRSSCCNPIECPYARDYYDKVGDVIFSLLESGKIYDRTAIAQAAKAAGICPYELSLDLSEYCDIIICDYNYIFDPHAYLRRYFENPTRESYIFLIDEAHNLCDRTRAMYSAKLKVSDFRALLAEEVLPVWAGTLREKTEEVCLHFSSLSRLCRDGLSKDAQGQDYGFALEHAPLTALHEMLSGYLKMLSAWRRENDEEEEAGRLIRLLEDKIKDYFSILAYFDEHFLTTVTFLSGEITVQLLCLDPAGVVNSCMNRASSVICFSATLTPLLYYADLLGSRKAEKLEISSPFPRKNLCLAAVDTVSTRFEDRQKSYAVIASCIAATVSGRAGNYIVYFPSYRYMEEVCKEFRVRYPQVSLYVQNRKMTVFEKETYLSQFKNDTGVLRIGFCVLGGSFSEGVDLPGSRLIGSIIVGVGLPGISNENNILCEYYENKCEAGFRYAYVYPGMNHVLQAAGRVIRREDDCGVVVLLDDRYATPDYVNLYPKHWRHLQFAGNPASLAEIIRRFWAEHPQTEISPPKP